MDDLANIVSENLITLRKEKHLTQQELAEKIGYSDKLISKWELGKAIPSVDKLMQLASFYNVPLDSIVTKNGCEKKVLSDQADKNMANKVVIMAMAGTFILFVAVAVFVNSILSGTNPIWISFMYMIPAIGLIDGLLDFKFYGRNIALWILLSVFVWGLLFAVSIHFFFYLDQNIFYVLLVGIPLQIVLILLSQFK